MKSVILITLFSVWSQILFAQEKFNFKAHSLEKIFKYEKRFNSHMKDTVDFSYLADPLRDNYTLVKSTAYIFERVHDDFTPRLHVWYMFSNETHKLGEVYYHWGYYNPAFDPDSNRELMEALTKKEDVFQKKYNELYTYLLARFGSTVKTDTIDNKNKLIKSDYWETKDKIIKLSMHFSRNIIEIPGVGIAPNFFRIGVTVHFKE